MELQRKDISVKANGGRSMASTDYYLKDNNSQSDIKILGFLKKPRYDMDYIRLLCKTLWMERKVLQSFKKDEFKKLITILNADTIAYCLAHTVDTEDIKKLVSKMVTYFIEIFNFGNTVLDVLFNLMEYNYKKNITTKSLLDQSVTTLLTARLSSKLGYFLNLLHNESIRDIMNYIRSMDILYALKESHDERTRIQGNFDVITQKLYENDVMMNESKLKMLWTLEEYNSFVKPKTKEKKGIIKLSKIGLAPREVHYETQCNYNQTGNQKYANKLEHYQNKYICGCQESNGIKTINIKLRHNCDDVSSNTNIVLGRTQSGCDCLDKVAIKLGFSVKKISISKRLYSIGLKGGGHVDEEEAHERELNAGFDFERMLEQGEFDDIPMSEFLADSGYSDKQKEERRESKEQQQSKTNVAKKHQSEIDRGKRQVTQEKAEKAKNVYKEVKWDRMIRDIKKKDPTMNILGVRGDYHGFKRNEKGERVDYGPIRSIHKLMFHNMELQPNIVNIKDLRKENIEQFLNAERTKELEGKRSDIQHEIKVNNIVANKQKILLDMLEKGLIPADQKEGILNTIAARQAQNNLLKDMNKDIGERMLVKTTNESPYIEKVGEDVISNFLVPRLHTSRASDGSFHYFLDEQEIKKDTWGNLHNILHWLDVDKFSKDFIEGLETMENKPFTWTDVGLGKMGNYTGRGHPEGWDGIWTEGNMVPANNMDFISSIHDMLVDTELSPNQRSALEHGFVNMWDRAAISTVDKMVPVIMDIKTRFYNDFKPEGFNIPENLLDRFGAERGDFRPEVQEPTVEGAGLDGGGRGDLYADYGLPHDMICATEYETEKGSEIWTPDAWPRIKSTNVTHYFNNVAYEAWNKLFQPATLITGTSDGRIFSNNTNDNFRYIGPMFVIKMVLEVNTFPPYQNVFTGIRLQQNLIPQYRSIKWKAGFESLASLNPESSFVGTASANRNYASTPFGNITSILALFKSLNIYAGYNKLSMFLPCLRMLQWAYAIQPSDINTLFGGGWPLNNSDITPYFTGVGTPGPYNTTSQLITFVNINDYLFNPSTATASLVDRALSGKILFYGGDQTQTQTVTDLGFVLQMVAIGCELPKVSHITTTSTIAGVAGDTLTYVDASMMYIEEGRPPLVICFTDVTPGAQISFRAGSIGWLSIGANQSFTVSDMTVGLINYEVGDIIGTYSTLSFTSVIADIGQFVSAWKCSADYNEALFFAQHHFSFRPAQTTVTNFVSDTGVLGSAIPATTNRAVTGGQKQVRQDAVLDWFSPIGLPISTTSGVGNSGDINLGDLSSNLYVPKETGKEFLVINGFCLGTDTVTEKLGFYNIIDYWISRYWMPEALNQAFYEVQTLISYPEGLMDYTTYSTNARYFDANVLNAFTWNFGLSYSSTKVPAGISMVADVIQRIYQLQIPIEYIITSCCSDYKDRITDPSSMVSCRNRVRPEFLMISGYTSERSTIYTNKGNDWVNTPKYNKEDHMKRIHSVNATSNYELAPISSSSVYLPPCPEDRKSWAAAIMLQFKQYTNFNLLTITPEGTTVTVIPKRFFSAISPSGLANYLGAHYATLNYLNFNLVEGSQIFLRNINEGNASIVDPSTRVDMSLVALNQLFVTTLGDPLNSNRITMNAKVFGKLMNFEVNKDNKDNPVIEPGKSPQEIAALGTGGTASNIGGEPVQMMQ